MTNIKLLLQRIKEIKYYHQQLSNNPENYLKYHQRHLASDTPKQVYLKYAEKDINNISKSLNMFSNISIWDLTNEFDVLDLEILEIIKNIDKRINECIAEYQIVKTEALEKYSDILKLCQDLFNATDVDASDNVYVRNYIDFFNIPSFSNIEYIAKDKVELKALKNAAITITEELSNHKLNTFDAVEKLYDAYQYYMKFFVDNHDKIIKHSKNKKIQQASNILDLLILESKKNNLNHGTLLDCLKHNSIEIKSSINIKKLLKDAVKPSDNIIVFHKHLLDNYKGFKCALFSFDELGNIEYLPDDLGNVFVDCNDVLYTFEKELIFKTFGKNINQTFLFF